MAPTTTLQVFILIFVLGCTSAIRTFYMDVRCGGTLDMANLDIESAKLKLTKLSNYRNNWFCEMTIRAPPEKQIMIKFRDVEIEDGIFGRCEDVLEVFDGRDSSSPHVGGLSYKICGERRPKGAFYTTQQYVTFQFKSDMFSNDDGFSLLFTAFHTGECMSDEVKCKRGQCISKTLECDGYNQCGDNSDECRVAGGTIVGIVIGGVIILSIIVVVLVCWRRRRATRGTVIKYNSPAEQATVVVPPPQQGSYPAQPVPAPQAYPQGPQPYQYPPGPQGYPVGQAYPPAGQQYPVAQQPYQAVPPSYNEAVQNQYPYGAPGQAPYPPEPK